MDDLKRLIDASPVYEDLRKSYEELQRIREMLTNHEDIQICNVQLATYKEAMQYIKNAPTVEAVEVVHGRWEPIRYGNLRIATCSACGWKHGLYINGNIPNYYYCPSCGAKMDKEVSV